METPILLLINNFIKLRIFLEKCYLVKFVLKMMEKSRMFDFHNTCFILNRALPKKCSQTDEKNNRALILIQLLRYYNINEIINHNIFDINYLWKILLLTPFYD
ncbi:hypothetical protein YYG_02905 [Plasmodium vinckei petteri]|uniref:Uncharacterized protein n=1 Tax=Plasmodium vinckei petteri TaxID=138298 RepID=W7AUE6_PLAVN|nr:hypothetical protein YYG_02905 [Plasmodium vinckei petteri]